MRAFISRPETTHRIPTRMNDETSPSGSRPNQNGCKVCNSLQPGPNVIRNRQQTCIHPLGGCGSAAANEKPSSQEDRRGPMFLFGWRVPVLGAGAGSGAGIGYWWCCFGWLALADDWRSANQRLARNGEATCTQAPGQTQQNRLQQILSRLHPSAVRPGNEIMRSKYL